MPRSPSGASARPSPRVLIKSLELNALHTSRIRDMVRLNGNRSNAVGETAKAEAAKANKRAEELRSDNIALQAGVRPRRFSFMGWTNNPERISKIYDALKPHAGTSVLIQ